MPIISGGGGGGTTLGSVTTVTGTAAASQVPVASSSSAAAWAYPPGFEIGYTQITSSANITDTSEATATALISPGALTFDGGAVLVHFFAAFILPPQNAIGATAIITLFEGATQITRLLLCETETTTTSAPFSMTAFYRFTPSVGSHTYKVCGFVSSTTGTPNIGAGAGGTGAYPPSFIRFTKV